MGLPAGHVTDVPGLSRNAQLKALGNGVVPQQGALALRLLLPRLLEARGCRMSREAAVAAAVALILAAAAAEAEGDAE